MKNVKDLLKKAKLNNDNNGSTLVVVVVCVMFIGILAVTMLMTSYMNYQMKLTDRLSSVNFHSAEGALDQMTAGLKVQSEKALEDAFEYTEKYYAATPQKERTNLINRRYITDFFGKLASEAGVQQNSAAAGTYVTQVSSNVKGEKFITLAASSGGTSASQQEKFCAYLKTLTLEGVDSDSSVSDRVKFSAGDGGNIVIAYNTEEYYVEVKNLKITYTDAKDYQTTITTDVRLTPPVSMPEDYFMSNSMKNSIVDDYAIIADGTVTSVTGGNTAAIGNVYSGGGIIAPSSTLRLDSDIVASREALEAKGSGRIIVERTKRENEEDTESKKTAQVWVKDLLTSLSDGSESTSTSTGTGTTSQGTSINIKGDCYVADDLIMNDPNHDVMIEGNYYGYNTGSSASAAGSRYDGSAIGINAVGANLKITGGLWLAGRNILEDKAYTSDHSSSTKVKEGESLSYKWTQNAYLIPGECIVGAEGQNPMPAETFEKLTGNGKLQLDFMNYPFITQINIEEYLDKDQPYTYKYVQQYDGTKQSDGTAVTNVVYVYMNFTDETNASTYFARYASYLTQRTALTAAANILGYGKVDLSSDVLSGKDGKFTGNIILFDKDETQAPGSDSAGTALSGNPYKNTFSQDEDKNIFIKDEDKNTNDDDGYESDPFRDSVTSSTDSILTDDTSGTDAGDGSGDSGDSDDSTTDLDKPATTKSYSPFGSLTLMEGNRSIYSGEMINRETESNYQYNGLISLLDKNLYLSYPAYQLVENMFSSKGLIEDADKDANVIYVPKNSTSTDSTGVNYEKIKLKKQENGKVLIDSSNNTGIVVADCDVVVETQFKGTIITTGNVELLGNATVEAKHTVGFDNVAKPEQTAETTERVKVTYRNWKKNK